MTTELTPWQMLREPFPAALVGKLPRGGVELDYVGHAAVTDRLLKVDPTWTWEPLALSPDGLPALDRAGNLWIRLTVHGVTRIGVGDGKNAKECISDAIRNAAMRFGVALDLWAKEDLHAVNGDQPAEPAPPKLKPPTVGAVKNMHRLFNEKGIVDRADRLKFTIKTVNRAIETSTDLTSTEVALVTRTLAAMNPAPPADPPGADQAGPDPSQAPAAGPATYQEKRKTIPPTAQLLERLDGYVADGLEHRFVTVQDVYVQVGAFRKQTVAQLAAEVQGFDSDSDRLLWQPLRDSLRRDEAGDLLSYLLELRRSAGLEDDIPF